MDAPTPPRLRRLKIRQGRCYEIAYRGLLAYRGSETWTLVHGEVGPVGARIGHAWLRCGEWIYDPVLDRLHPVDEYGEKLRPLIAAEYTIADAVERSLASQHYGPWCGAGVRLRSPQGGS